MEKSQFKLELSQSDLIISVQTRRFFHPKYSKSILKVQAHRHNVHQGQA